MNTIDLKKLQQTELEVLKHFHQYCTENGLRYYLIGGALLGAARYGGFIPWDDDIDVTMPREDYERLKKMYDSSEYFLQNTDSEAKFARCIMKLRKNGTHIVERCCQHVKMHDGVYIDIFPIDYVAHNSPAILNKRAKEIRRWWTLRTIKSGYYGNHMILKTLIRWGIFWLPASAIDKKIDKLCTLENGGERNYAILFLHNYWWEKQIHEPHVFGDGTVCSFEGEQFIAPSDMHAFLSRVFGEDYMKEPPVEKQKRPHRYVSLSYDAED